MPNTTQGNVFPMMNSRILVISNNRPPRKMIGPLFSSLDGALSIHWFSHMKATPFPLAPLQPIKQHETGVVVMTKPPSALHVQSSQTKLPCVEYSIQRLTMVSDFQPSSLAMIGEPS